MSHDDDDDADHGDMVQTEVVIQKDITPTAIMNFFSFSTEVFLKNVKLSCPVSVVNKKLVYLF
jgi:hypothetical protein